MFTLPEQFSAATKANIDAQLAVFSSLTDKAIENFEKVVDLNMTATKAALEETKAATEKLAASKDAQEFFSLAAAGVQPNAEKLVAYGRHLMSITNGAQSELSKAAEAHLASTNQKVVAFIDEISKHAPAGSENIVNLFKSTIGNVSAGYDQLSRSTKQVAETIEANLNSAASQYAQATPKATSRAKK